MKKNKNRMVGGDSLLTNETYHIVGEIRYLDGEVDVLSGFYRVSRDYPSDSYWVDLVRMDTSNPGLGNGLNFRFSPHHGDRLHVSTLKRSHQARWKGPGPRS